MAEIRLTRDGDPDATLPGGLAGDAGVNRTPETDPEHLLPAHAGAGVPGTVAAIDDPGVVRDEIERTRARMSQTIDSIETALLRKKEQIEEKLDVTAPVRERVQSQPLMYAGGVFGAGLLLGFLTGGKDEDVEEIRRLREQMSRGGAVPTMEVGLGADTAGYAYSPPTGGKYEGKWKSRAREWEKEVRELRRACDRQEHEIRALRASLDGEHRSHMKHHQRESHHHHEEGGRGLMGVVSGGLSSAVAGTVARLMGGRREEMEVEVELEQPHSAPRASYDRPLQSREDLYGQPRGGYAQGEMEVEVELEQPHGTPHPYYNRPAGERFYERQQQDEMVVEVELEQPHSRRKPALLGALGVGVAAAVAGAVARLLSERHEEELEVEVELERPVRPRAVTYTETTGYAEYDVAPGRESEMVYERPGEGDRYYGRPASSSEMEVEVDLEDRSGYVARDDGYRHDNPR
jgi:hypothetical protein